MAQINKPSEYFNTVLYTGTGSTLSITGVGFAPDLTWVKRRSSIRGHTLCDQVRGDGYNLYPELDLAQAFATSTFTSLDSDGFTLGADDRVNQSSGTHVSWNWKANGSGVSNTDGSITSTVSANTTSGFSIVTYTGNGSSGATIGHGLGSAPSFITVKRLDTTGDWWSYHKSLLATYYIKLNSSAPAGAGSTIWNDTTPTSSVFTLGNNAGINASGGTYVAYCFAEKKGFSKFGSYVGNGSSDGSFIYTGMKPAFLLYKCSTDNFTNWQVFDNKRSTYNLAVNRLNPNDTSAELATTADSFDLLSNGFKARNNGANSNNSGSTFIYMVFAENPLVGTNNIPATAR